MQRVAKALNPEADAVRHQHKMRVSPAYQLRYALQSYPPEVRGWVDDMKESLARFKAGWTLDEIIDAAFVLHVQKSLAMASEGGAQ